MFKWAQPLPLVFAFACAASGRVAAEVPAPPKASAGGAQAAERYVSEIGADLASLDSHFQKYREAAEKLSALYAKLAAKAAEVGAAASGKGAAAGMGAAGGPGLGTAVGGDSQSQLLQATKQMQETQIELQPAVPSAPEPDAERESFLYGCFQHHENEARHGQELDQQRSLRSGETP